jgi:hypothetical protein
MAAISADAIGKAITAQFEFMGKVIDQSSFLLYEGVFKPAQIAQSAYLQRLLASLPTFNRNPYEGLYDAQLRRQTYLMYAIIGLLFVVVIASIFKKK